MRWIAITVVVLSGIALSGCPEDVCRGNEDCTNGYSCTPEGECVKTYPLEIETVSLPYGVVGETYQVSFTARGGLKPYTWVVETDQTWLSMGASTGTIVGTPTEIVSNADMKVLVTDSSYGDGEEASRDFLLNVAYCDESQASPCSGHGSCASSVCECDDGYIGNQCDACDEGYHESQGQCVLDEVCEIDSCSGHGTCEDSSGVIECTCDEGYRGSYCSECASGYHEDQGECVKDEVCLENSCDRHGTCEDSSGVVVCRCDAGYEGDHCESCEDGYHREGGECLANEVCDANPCSGHGTCDDSSGMVICTCNEGYDGEHCESCAGGYHDNGGVCVKDQVCLPNSCSGHGTCDDSTGVVVCNCNEGYKGEYCEIFVVRKLEQSDRQDGDNFGCSFAFSGEYAIVGARYEDGGPGDPINNAGAAYIFNRTGMNTWDEGTKLTASDAQSNDRFGHSVSISGDYAIVGAYVEDGGPGDPLNDAGAAYIFKHIGFNTWDGGIKLTASDAQADDFFGYTVSISGNYAIVGAYKEDGGPGDSIILAGAAYIFRRTGLNEWGMGTKLTAPDAQTLDNFGISVSISGDYAIVGAYGEDGGSGDPINSAGAAYIFKRTGTNTWDEGTKLTANDAQASDWFGDSVSISDDYAIVLAYGEDGGSGDPINSAGAAYIFRRIGTNTWDEGTKLTASDAQANDRFGSSVSISGDFAIVGVQYENGGPGDPFFDSGAAYIFIRTGQNTWEYFTKLTNPNPQDNGYFGAGVSVSGGYFASSTYSEDGAGAAYVFYP